MPPYLAVTTARLLAVTVPPNYHRSTSRVDSAAVVLVAPTTNCYEPLPTIPFIATGFEIVILYLPDGFDNPSGPPNNGIATVRIRASRNFPVTSRVPAAVLPVPGSNTMPHGCRSRFTARTAGSL